MSPKCQHIPFFFFNKGVFNTTSSNICNQSPTNGREVISLRPNKQRTKKSKNPFGSCSLFWVDDWLSLRSDRPHWQTKASSKRGKTPPPCHHSIDLTLSPSTLFKPRPPLVTQAQRLLRVVSCLKSKQQLEPQIADVEDLLVSLRHVFIPVIWF